MVVDVFLIYNLIVAVVETWVFHFDDFLVCVDCHLPDLLSEFLILDARLVYLPTKGLLKMRCLQKENTRRDGTR